MTYHQFKNDHGDSYGSFEVFHNGIGAEQVTVDEIGWYWAAGFPGCVWDGEPVGPFATETEAIENAQENA